MEVSKLVASSSVGVDPARVARLKALLDACEAKGVQFMDGTMWYHSKRTRAIEAQTPARISRHALPVVLAVVNALGPTAACIRTIDDAVPRDTPALRIIRNTFARAILGRAPCFRENVLAHDVDEVLKDELDLVHHRVTDAVVLPHSSARGPIT